MRIVIALGGGAITGPQGSLEAGAVRRAVRDAAAAVADIARGYEVVITHGNGPQVGMLSMQGPPLPGAAPSLDLIGAETEGLIGYLIEQELASIFPSSEVATLLTQVEIDPEDPAFAQPSKPIGPRVSQQEARTWGERYGWHFRPEGEGFRRVVPSPAPRRIRELRTIEILVEAGVLVVSAGGGGIPVVEGPDGGLHGVEALLDKDHTAALLAEGLRADALLLLTDVPAVYEDWPEPRRKAVRTAGPKWLRGLTLEPASMGAKLEAACRFVEATGGQASIGRLAEARRVLQGLSGTRVLPGDEPPTHW